MKFLRLLAYPLALIYGSITFLRNKCYDLGFISARDFNIPIISVGNLTSGGTGKTPHIEYLIRLLKKKYKLATLSRGYGRKSSGFLLADENSSSFDIGDEPRQFKKKFDDDIIVAVDGNRVRGIKKLLKAFSDLKLILLDDAFQHRAVKAGLSILLTDYSNMYYDDNLLPTGTLREFKSGVERADIIIVTKTPQLFSPLEKRRVFKEIKPEAYQRVYFSYIKYGNFISFHDRNKIMFDKELYFRGNYTIMLLSGIANSAPLEYFLKQKTKKLLSERFSDHHEYSIAELNRVREKFNAIPTDSKIIITTEKDAMRLDKPGLKEILQTLPLFYIPIEVCFHDKDEEEFNNQITDYVKRNQVHLGLH